MGVDAAVTRGRAAAEALMVDQCRITRTAARTGTDPVTGRDVLGVPVLVYAGPCRVQVPAAVEEVRPSGERRWTLQRLTLSLPMSAEGIAVNDDVQVTSSALDVDLPNRRYRVAASFAKTHATARRVTCQEVTG